MHCLKDIIVEDEKNIDCFKCPIGKGLLNKPISANCGHSFCRKCLKEYLQTNTECPVDGKFINKNKLNPNINLEDLIKQKKLICKNCSLELKLIKDFNHNKKICNLFKNNYSDDFKPILNYLIENEKEVQLLKKEIKDLSKRETRIRNKMNNRKYKIQKLKYKLKIKNENKRVKRKYVKKKVKKQTKKEKEQQRIKKILETKLKKRKLYKKKTKVFRKRDYTEDLMKTEKSEDSEGENLKQILRIELKRIENLKKFCIDYQIELKKIQKIEIKKKKNNLKLMFPQKENKMYILIIYNKENEIINYLYLQSVLKNKKQNFKLITKKGQNLDHKNICIKHINFELRDFTNDKKDKQIWIRIWDNLIFNYEIEFECVGFDLFELTPSEGFFNYRNIEFTCGSTYF